MRKFLLVILSLFAVAGLAVLMSVVGRVLPTGKITGQNG